MKILLLILAMLPPVFSNVDTNPADAFPSPAPTVSMTFRWDAVVCDHYEFYHSKFYPVHLELIGTTKSSIFTFMASNYPSGYIAVCSVGSNGYQSQLTWWRKQ